VDLDRPCGRRGVGRAEELLRTRRRVRRGRLDRLGEGDGRDRNHNYEAALFAQAVGEIAQMVELLGGRHETPFGLAGVGDLLVTSTGGRNIRAGRLLGSGLRMSEARARVGTSPWRGPRRSRPSAGGVAQADRPGVIGGGDFPLLRRLYGVVGQEQPPEVPWSVFFGGEAGAVAAARETAG
jgi:glycerol-3-phosphate dehydrogenase (NAD(P)+)